MVRAKSACPPPASCRPPAHVPAVASCHAPCSLNGMKRVIKRAWQSVVIACCTSGPAPAAHFATSPEVVKQFEKAEQPAKKIPVLRLLQNCVRVVLYLLPQQSRAMSRRAGSDTGSACVLRLRVWVGDAIARAVAGGSSVSARGTGPHRSCRVSRAIRPTPGPKDRRSASARRW